MNSKILKKIKIAYALVDCNNFYASCERVFQPKIRNKPVIILSNNDGCAVAMSNEAKKLGIKIGTPYFKISNLVNKSGGVVFSSNYELYGDMSNRVMNVLKSYSPTIEFYSIDEAFLRIDHIESNYDELGRKIKNEVFRRTGIPVSVGIAPTKTLAKVANRFAKKKGLGSLNLCNKSIEQIDDLLKEVDVFDIWGIGRRKGMKLHYYKVDNAYKLKYGDDSWIKKQLGGLPGLRVIWELRGMDCIELEEIQPKKKQILSSRSFGKLIDDYKEMEQAVAFYAARSAEKLRKQNSYAQMVHVYVATNRFKENLPQHKQWYNIPCPEPTNYTPDIVNCALKGLFHLFKEGFMYKKAAVMLTELIDEDEKKSRLFQSEDSEKKTDLMKVMDSLNNKYGKHTLNYGVNKKYKDWYMKREYLSKRATTRWDEILEVNI